MTKAWLCTVLLLGAACSSPLAPSTEEELSAARARWAAHGSTAYSFELTRGCFCLMAGRRIRVSVTGGAVATAHYVDSGDTVEQAFLAYLPTVPDLFDLVADAVARDAAALAVSYDEFYGHPTRIAVDYSATAIDDELTLDVSGLLIDEARSTRP